jgi:AcrR family transcriptional regulator
MARRPPSQARSIFLVDVILEAAVRVFASLGYRASTTRTVADVAGVSVGSLYQYFQDKKDLARALLAREAEDFKEPLSLLPHGPVSCAEFKRRFNKRLAAALRLRKIGLPRTGQLFAAVPDLLFSEERIVQTRQSFARALASDLRQQARTIRPANVEVAAIVLDRVFNALLAPVELQDMDKREIDDDAYCKEVVDLINRYLFSDDG